MVTVDFYSKQQTDTLLSDKADTSALPTSAQLVPSTTGASSGDVLTFDGSAVGWSAGGGGGSSHTTVNVTVADLYSTLNGLASGTNFIIRAHKYTNSAKFVTMEIYGNKSSMTVDSNTTYIVCGTMTRYYSNSICGNIKSIQTANQAKWVIYYNAGGSNGSFNIGETATTHELLGTDYVEVEYW